MTPCPAGTFPYTVRSGDSLWLLAQRFHTSAEAIAAANPALAGNRIYIGQTLCIPREYTPHRPLTPPAGACVGAREQALGSRLRMLWEQHVYWTRMAILGIVFDLPDAQFTADRLLRNPKDFEAVLRLFYGAGPAAEFADLFTSHLMIADELVKAAKAGDDAAAAEAERRWYENAAQIASFLAAINPYWTQQEWQKMFFDHLAMTKTEAGELLGQKYADSIRTFERIEQEALMMADAMTRGLVRQFPTLFA